MTHPNCTARRITLFWNHARKTESCWLWEGMISEYGYGRLRWDERWFQAHRVAYFIAYGEFDPCLDVCHTCDVRHCVNPAHLFLGTAADNMRDMDAKGRRNPAQGTRTRHAKINDDIVREIRRLRADGLTYQAIGAIVGLSKPGVGHVLRGHTWKHVA